MCLLLQGTTGLPKAAMLSHHMIANNAYGIGLRAEYHKKVSILVTFDERLPCQYE